MDSDDYFPDDDFFLDVDNLLDDIAGEDTDPKSSATAIAVVNFTGAELPSTGGIGTTIFYMVGGILMAGAAILLITKKKMSNEQ